MEPGNTRVDVEATVSCLEMFGAAVCVLVAAQHTCTVKFEFLAQILWAVVGTDMEFFALGSESGHVLQLRKKKKTRHRQIRRIGIF